MEKEFVPYELAVKLKALGFDEECLSYYFNKQLSFGSKTSYGEVVEAPLYQQAFRWFREKHQIVCVIDFYNDGDLWEDTIYTVTISEFEHFKSHDSFVQFEYKTYEDAELACLRKLIEIVKNKQI